SAWGDRMKTLGKDEKPIVGKLLNEVRNTVTVALESRAASFRSQKESEALARIDVSLPGIPHDIGALHPLTQMWQSSIEIFRRIVAMKSMRPTSRSSTRSRDFMWMKTSASPI